MVASHVLVLPTEVPLQVSNAWRRNRNPLLDAPSELLSKAQQGLPLALVFFQLVVVYPYPV
jgi:hypothetical protein